MLLNHKCCGHLMMLTSQILRLSWQVTHWTSDACCCTLCLTHSCCRTMGALLQDIFVISRSLRLTHSCCGIMYALLQDIFVISHSPSGMETGKSKSEERSKLLTDPVVTGIAYEINKANKKLNQHRLQVCIDLVCHDTVQLWLSPCKQGRIRTARCTCRAKCVYSVQVLTNVHPMIMCALIVTWTPVGEMVHNLISRLAFATITRASPPSRACCYTTVSC